MKLWFSSRIVDTTATHANRRRLIRHVNRDFVCWNFNISPTWCDVLRCDAMPCDVIGAGGAPSSWIDLLPPGTRLPVRLHTRHACSYTNSMRLIIRSNGCSTDGSPFFFWFCALFVWPRVTSTTMTRTFKICSTDPGGAGRARWSKTHSHGPLIGTMPQYGLQINWPASIAAESPKSYLCPRPREDGILKERVALKILL